MRELDGADAGGQFLRTALALAALEDETVRIENVRGGRETSGLRPQHLAAVETLAAIRDADVAARQAGGALERLAPADRGLEVAERVETTAASDCPGSAVVLRVDHGSGVAGFSALGEPGKPAERVGEAAADAADRFLAGDAPVDRHAADQLLPLLALAGGRVRIPAVTGHVETGLALLETLGYEIGLEAGDADGGAVVAAEPRTRP
ncbi:RNA 3'-terminal phosphate cyclase [Salinilacihabitans rarus]|uniref:RNA 3'-terminal phosphate cyclase n=1 Tax=Salinilacihabitans rarus TaxID=2961596 RepID=UPI0020C8E2AD|nr:RNA 3'-terminal phosphate cyclase [Salinilacihabitans rarus]